MSELEQRDLYSLAITATLGLYLEYITSVDRNCAVDRFLDMFQRDLESHVDVIARVLNDD